MFKYALSACVLTLLFGCAALSHNDAVKEPVATQENTELVKLLETLLVMQIESSEDIKAELEKTAQSLANISNPKKVAQKSDRPKPQRSISRPDWLAAEGKILVGGIEKIALPNEEIIYGARIDTGATSSSIDARDLTRFERDGDRWVRFKLYRGDKPIAEVERPIIRWVRVFQSDNLDGSRRPVVEMTYQLGDYTDTAEFTLTNRSHLEFPVLIGRNIITDRMIVDVSSSFIQGNKD